MNLTLALEFKVYGNPGPQGSKRHIGGGRMLESSAKVKPWREAVTAAAMARRAALGLELLDGPLRVDMVFTFVRPASHYGTGRNKGRLKDSAPLRPATAPDLSKLARSTEDALNKFVWVDDARVVEYGYLAKVWASSHTPTEAFYADALDAPGAIIRIYQIGANQ